MKNRCDHVNGDMSATVRVDLAPKAGFCVKSSCLTAAVLPPPPTPSPSNSNLLEPTPGPIPVPKGLKVFVNIAWDPHVPPPPEGNEDAIKRAIQGEDVDKNDPSVWYVPVIVSNGRQDTDKGTFAFLFGYTFADFLTLKKKKLAIHLSCLTVSTTLL